MSDRYTRRQFVAGVGAMASSAIASASSALDPWRPLSGRAVEESFSGAVRKARASVVRIMGDRGNRGGSGFFVGDRWILTAEHVFTKFDCRLALFVTHFERDSTPVEREYYVWDGETPVISGRYKRDKLTVGLDYVLVRVRRDIPHASCLGPQKPAPWLRGAYVGTDDDWNVNGFVVGCPSSSCVSYDRDWAYMTATEGVISNTSNATPWQLNLSATTCQGFSGSPVMDKTGSPLGLVSTQNVSTSDDTERLGRVVSLKAIAADLRSKWVEPLAFPEGLDLLRCDTFGRGTGKYAVVAPEPAEPNRDDDELPLFVDDTRAVAKKYTVCGAAGLIRFRINDEPLVPFAQCVHLGEGWIITVKHLIDAAARLPWADVFFGNDLSSLYAPGNWKLRRDLYFSSDDRTYSLDGKTLVLDYALVRLAPGWDNYPPTLVASGVAPRVGVSLVIPRHWQSEQTRMMRSARVLLDEGNVVAAIDTRRIYYRGAVRGGDSGAALLDPDGKLIGLHTNSATPRCSSGTLNEFGNPVDGCRRLNLWETKRTPVEEAFYAFGSRITAIIQDLRIRHKIDSDSIPACKGLLIRDTFDYKIGGTDAK